MVVIRGGMGHCFQCPGNGVTRVTGNVPSQKKLNEPDEDLASLQQSPKPQ